MKYAPGIPRFVRNDKALLSFRDPAFFAGSRNPCGHKMQKYYVYILNSTTGTLYVGITNILTLSFRDPAFLAGSRNPDRLRMKMIRAPGIPRFARMTLQKGLFIV